MTTARSFRAILAVLTLAGCGGEEPPTGVTGDLELASTIPVEPYVHDVFVRDGLAFVCGWNSGLLIYDVGNGMRGGSPSNPQRVSQVITSSVGLNGAHVHNAWWFHNPNTGEKRYVFVGQEGPGEIGQWSTGDMHVVDVSDLTQPREVAFFHLSGTPETAGPHNFWMDEAAEILYMAYYNGGVVALDVSGTLDGDLASRVIDRVVPGAGSYVWGVQLHEGSVYATDMNRGFYQLRLDGTTLSVVAGGDNSPDRLLSDLWVHGDHAYTGTYGRVTSTGNALKIWQLDATGAPALADSVIVPGIGTVSDVEISSDGRLLMISAENGPDQGLLFYSLANPTRPALLTQVRVETGVHTATLADIGGRRYAFAVKNPVLPQVLVIDVTELSN